MNITTVHLLILQYFVRKYFKNTYIKTSSIRRHACIKWRHWVSGTLPTVLIVENLMLSFIFFKKVVVDQSHFLKCPAVNQRIKCWSLRGRLSSESTKQKRLECPRSLNELQKHHWGQWSAIICNQPTMDLISEGSHHH